jgi:hypothetical protein
MSTTIIPYTFFVTYNNELLEACYTFFNTMCEQILHAVLYVVTKTNLTAFSEFFFNLAYPARWHRFTWIDFNDWLYSGSDIRIWLAYFIISFFIVLSLTKRPQIYFHYVVVFFKT